MTATDARYGRRGGRWAGAPQLEKKPTPVVAMPRTRARLIAHLLDMHPQGPNGPTDWMDAYSLDELRLIHDAEHKHRLHGHIEFLGHAHPTKGSEAPVVDADTEALMKRANARARDAS